MPDKARYRRQTLLARLTALFYEHVHGQTPTFADDFRRAARAVYQAPVGDHRATVEGAPKQVDPTGESGVKALNFDGSNAQIEIPDDPGLDSGAGDNFSVGAIHEYKSSSQAFAALIAKRSGGGAGWMLLIRTVGNLQLILDDGTSTDNNTYNENLRDDELHLLGGSFDSDDATNRAIVDGSVVGAESQDATGDRSNDEPVMIGRPADGEHKTQQLAWKHDEWTSEPQWAFLDALCRTGDVASGTLQRLRNFLIEDGQGGWGRRLPDALPSAVDRWWSHERRLHGDDTIGVVQLEDQSGENFGTQRTDSAKPSVIRSGDIGAAADYLTFGGDDHISESGFTNDPSAISWSGRIRQASGQSGTVYVWSHNDGGTAEASLEYDADNNRYQATIVDSAGNTVTLTDTASGIDPTDGFHDLSLRFDESGDHALRVDGTEVASDTTDLSGNDITSTKRQLGAQNGGSQATFDLSDRAAADAAWTDSEFSTYEASL